MNARNARVCQVAGARGDVLLDEDISDVSSRLYFGNRRRLPVIRQSEASECGLACLAMICAYHGNHTDLASLRQRFPLSLKGVTLARLVDMAQSLGFSSRPLRLELDELGKLQMPCILHWNLDHFVVLREIGKRHVIIHDPAIGERRLTPQDLSSHFTGIALEVCKSPTFQRKRPDPPVSLRSLAGSIEGLSRALTTIFGLALVLELFALLTPQFMQMVVDQVLADGDYDLLTFLGLSFLALLGLQTVVSALRTWTIVWLSTHFNLSWSGNVFQHLLKLPQAYFTKRHLGDIVSRFGAISVIQETLTTQFVTVILDGLMTVLTLIVMLVYSPLLTAVTGAALGLYAILRMLYYRTYFESNLSQITVSAKQQSCFLESVRGVQTLRLYNQEPAQTARYLNATADTLNTSIAIQRLNLLFGSLSGLTGGIERIGVLWLGAWLALKGAFSAGMLMAFVAYADQFASRGANLVDYIVQFRLLRLQAERLADIVLTPTEPYAEGSYASTLEPSIRFDHVSFRYGEGEPWVIRDCSFEIKPGEAVAIIGPSGCGKSTLAKLLLGLLDPQSGSISIGGVGLKLIGKHALRSMTGSVMQDDQLFAGTIADNICFFDGCVDMNRIHWAAKIAQIDQDILTMPMAYRTLVGDMGSSLSGGQQQRLHLARAVYNNPRILVLDEATSHVDSACEMRINAALGQLSLTRIVIAHRAQTIANADRIISLPPPGPSL